MSEKTPGAGSERWRSIDAHQDPESFVSYLDLGASILRQIRANVIRDLEINPGCSVLDIGSGAGEFLIDVATSVVGVKATGIDISRVMVDTAASRAQAAGVDITFMIGNAEQLEFPEESFDRVNCSRVLMHLEQPASAVAEMARVLKPGGRLAIVEPDFDSVIIDSDDLDVARKVRHHLTDSVRNPDIGRRLRRHLMESGLEPRDVTVTARPMPNLRVVVDQFGLYKHLDSAVQAGDVTAETASRWRAWLEAADASGRLCIVGLLFRALAIKPSG